jgi:hypothetical protein
MNVQALAAVAVFGGVLTLILVYLYVGAVGAHKRGELGADGVRVLRWAIFGQLVIYGILAITAFVV